MSGKKKTEKTEKLEKLEKLENIIEEPVVIVEENIKDNKKTPKYPIGSIVFIHKDADADLNGFKLFPQYKKYTYTVEAYDVKSEVYSLRRLNLSLRLKEADLMAPHEKSGSALISKQY